MIELLHGIGMIMHPIYFFYMFAGVAFGLILGALPGLQGSMGIALMLPFTYRMDALSALVFLLSIYSGGLFGGSITAVLLNTPGSPANMATILDGYPMTLKGESNRALGLSIFCSVIGGLIGCVFLVSVMKPLAAISLSFGPSEMFMIVIFGLTIVGSLSKNVLKSIFGGLFGVLIGTIGTNSLGTMRGTFGIPFLFDGLPLIPTLIGFLALPEIFDMVKRQTIANQTSTNSDIRSILRSMKDIIKHPIAVLRAAVIGIVVGIMPAAGASIGSIVSYNVAKQSSNNPDSFGTGIPEGVIASETANNASEGGSLATMLVLGIPGSTSTAMLVGAIILQGWTPGPRLFIDHSDIIYGTMASLFLQQFVMLILGVIVCYYAGRILNIPTKYLIPCIMMFTIIGSYSGRSLLFDTYLMVGFGCIGFLMKRYDFPLISLVLGVVLGPLADKYLLRMYQMYSGNMWAIFLRPGTTFLAVLSVLSIFLPLIMEARRKKARSSVQGM